MGNKWFSFSINSISSLLYKKEYKRFVSVDSIERIQREKLFQIIKDNKKTDYGKKFDFNSIDSVSAYQREVPLTIYEDYVDYIEKIKDGKENVLTRGRVLLLEPTSGSTSASKYIPYTESLKKEFQKALKPWIYDLYNSYKDIKWGEELLVFNSSYRRK